MSTAYTKLKDKLRRRPHRWVITGVAGFIGSNLLEALLDLDQTVVGIDNFSTGFKKNLEDVELSVGKARWRRFTLVEADIRDAAACRQAVKSADFVLHQAALGSVPRSLEDPLTTNENNVTGFLNMLDAARTAPVKRFVYASSSSVYGDHPQLPKVETEIGKQLSPYAVSKYTNELYADVFSRCYRLSSIGLRYFNIFGPRQDPAGAYAAVIPKWFNALVAGRQAFINGDGETSRDFCYIANAVQANLLAALAPAGADGQVYNVACSQRTTLNELFELIRSLIAEIRPEAAAAVPEYRDFRPGDVRHSLARIEKAERLLGYQPEFFIKEGMVETARWYTNNLSSSPSAG